MSYSNKELCSIQYILRDLQNKQTNYFGNEFFLETVNVLLYIYSELFNTSLH